MVHYKFLYFAVRGRSEYIRYIFHQAGQEFTDEHVEVGDFAKLKEAPMGLLPVLLVDDKPPLCQTTVIASYLAQEFGLAGKNRFEAAQCAMLAEGINDFIHDNIRPMALAMFSSRDMEKAAELRQQLIEAAATKLYPLYDKFLEQNKTGWFVGEKITYADLCVGEFFSRMEEYYDPKALDRFPRLREHYKRIHELPNIKKFVQNRKYPVDF